MKRLISLLVLLSLLIVVPASAQEETAVQLPSIAVLEITWPPPVTEVWGSGDVLGTANVSDMAYYYLEYKQLSDDLTEPEDAPWLPATAALSEPVVNGVLATLDTTTAPDGVYSIRLTASTNEGQSFHYVVSPIRVNNDRFAAVEARIREESLGESTDSATPTPEPTAEPPADTRPRVTPSGVAVNVRRCTLVDNDRCPNVTSLAPATFALVVGRNLQNTWFQVRLDSGATGWVSRTVIIESGDFSSVAVASPPDPLPPRPQVPTPTPPTSVIPNGMSIQGGAATCNQQFNVQVNMGNIGSSIAASGSVTLQDVDVRTGVVTYTGYGSYPSLNPGANYVVVIPVNSSVYYNEDHELRAFANGHQYSIRYTLQQGNCGAVSGPSQLPANQRHFAASECSLVVDQYAELSNSPEGQVNFVAGAGTYPALQVQRVGGMNWYQINFADAPAWMPVTNVSSYQGNCGL
ncbi:MAG: hypothetical protein KC546_09090 [Anaerolineae bacterium]|nr:hypothetical protein [Anaerolineae bacterium]